MSTPKNPVLKRRLLLTSVIFIAILPVFLSALFVTYRSFQQAKLDAVYRSNSLLSHISEKQDQLIAQTFQSLRILALLPEVRQGGNTCGKFLARFIEQNPFYENAALVRLDGNVSCSALPLKAKTHVHDRDWFKLVMRTGSAQIGGLQLGKISKKPNIVAALPILDKDEEVQSILYLALSVQWLEDVFAEYALPKDSKLTALDANGLVLFEHPKLAIKSEDKGHENPYGKLYPKEKIRDHIQRAGTSIQPARLREETEHFVYIFERIATEDRVAMVVVLRIPELEIYHDAKTNAFTLISGLLLSVLTTFLLAYIAAKYLFLKPVEAEIEKLHDEAETDPLTNVLNRRGFERLASEALSAAGGSDHHAVSIIDIDHFKAINDTYGHPAGDAVLKEFAHRIKTVLRDNEIFGRIGGEEFALFIPHVTRETSIVLAERIRTAVNSLPFTLDEKKLTVTASLGVCHATSRMGLTRFLEKADKALYRSKRSGRDRVSI